MKYLGIILDQRFRFVEHIKYTAERCGKLIHSLSRAAKMTWGSNKRLWISYTQAQCYRC
jgi:hypothetical protein